MSIHDIVAVMKAEADTARVARNASKGSIRIIAITTNGGDREDGNTYYTWHYVVESSTLNFDEPIFNDPDDDKLFELGLIEEKGSACDALEKIADHMRSLGYRVHDYPTHIITIGDDG